MVFFSDFIIQKHYIFIIVSLLISLGPLSSLRYEELAKFIYTLDMYFGSLETFPILVVLSLLFRSNRR